MKTKRVITGAAVASVLAASFAVQKDCPTAPVAASVYSLYFIYLARATRKERERHKELKSFAKAIREMEMKLNGKSDEDKKIFYSSENYRKFEAAYADVKRKA